MTRNSLRLFFLYVVLSLVACAGDDTPPTPVTLSINPNSVAFDAEDGSSSISVSSNGDWSVSTSVDWVSVDPQSGTGDASITISAPANTDNESRSTLVRISAGDVVREVTVSQAGTTPVDPVDPPPNTGGIRDLTSVELTQLMGVGWNLGNSLDAVGGETAWGNPLVTQELINSVKAAGFQSVRLPVAWSQFSDESNFVIDSGWMNRVEEVVNYILNADMYVVMNIHWDEGWMQPTYAQEDYVNNRLAIMWEQIANHFRDYDDRLLFAGTNEVMVEGDYGTPTEEYYTVQNGFNQTFVDTVRATNGNNALRHLVVQGFNTNIDHTVNFASIPDDSAENRLMMEVHYYDPYNFTLNESSNITQWGEIADDPDATETWANESYTDTQFQRMKTNFVDRGIGVILGEYGVISRPYAENHEIYRTYWNEYITQSAIDHGLVPFYWDNGYAGEHGLALFDRNTGQSLYPDIIEALVRAAR